MRMGEGARGRAAASRSRRVRSAGEIWPPEGRELGGELRAEGMDSGEIVARVAGELEVSPGLVKFIIGHS